MLPNPAGIQVDGGGFINVNRATLTTGTPQFNAQGGLDSFVVRGGSVSIDGAGLDAAKTDYAAILARAVQVNAGIWANELKVVAGANQVSADSSQVSPAAGNSAAPSFALDVAALGGMYAGKITLVSAGNDLTVSGSQLVAQDQLSLSATRDVRIQSAEETSSQSSYYAQRKSGFSASVLSGVSYGKSAGAQNQTGQSTTQIGSTLSGGNVSIDAGREPQHVQGQWVLGERECGVHGRRRSAAATGHARPWHEP